MTEIAKRTLTIERSFEAPVELLWQVWSRAEHIANWWGPGGMETKVDLHNFEVDGKWQYSMLMPDGNAFISEGVYTSIEEGKKIYTSANFKPMTEGVDLHIELETKGDKTLFKFSCIHPSEEYCKQQEQMGFYKGWDSTFDRLENYLNTLNR